MNKKGIELGLAFTLCLSFFVSPVVAYSTPSDVSDVDTVPYASNQLLMNCNSPVYTSIEDVTVDSLLTMNHSGFFQIGGSVYNEAFLLYMKMPDRVNSFIDSYYSVNDNVAFYLLHSVSSDSSTGERWTIVNANDINYVHQRGGAHTFANTKWGEYNGNGIYFRNIPFFCYTDFSIPRYSYIQNSFNLLVNQAYPSGGFAQFGIDGLSLPLLATNANIPSQQGLTGYFLGFSSPTLNALCSSKSPNGNLDNTIGEYDKIESEQVDNMVENLGKVDTSNPVLSNNGFVNSSKFLATQLTNIYNIEPFKMMSTYSLVIGLALIIVGIGVRKR